MAAGEPKCKKSCYTICQSSSEGKGNIIPSMLKRIQGNHHLFQFIPIQSRNYHTLPLTKGSKSLSTLLLVYLFEHENDIGWCLKLETSNNSINLWSEILALAAAKRWYSSKTEVRHHRCNFLKHPTRQPVRCFPLLQWINRGWFLTSRTTLSASRIVSSGILTKGSFVPSIPNWNKWIRFDFKNSTLDSGYGSGHKYTIERRPRVCKKEKLAMSGKPDLKMPLSTRAKLRGGV